MSTQAEEVVDHLFRREWGRLVATLIRVFGPAEVAWAEDVAQDTLCRALEVWKIKGIPENPRAWLGTVAKNLAIDRLRGEARRRELLDGNYQAGVTADDCNALLDNQDAPGDQLRLMFSCCHPDLSVNAQATLVLRLLCGFSVDEISAAFLANRAAVEKRLSRARSTLGQAGSLFEVSRSAEVLERMNGVHTALYLLFNEGYHSNNPRHTVRSELCFEAMRLSLLLANHRPTATPATHALVALMCFCAARLGSRVDATGRYVLLEAQDRSLWDRALIARGVEYLERAASGDQVTGYHLEAGIAAKHCTATDFQGTDWKGIVELYDQLIVVRPTPVIALNRAIALGMSEGPEVGIDALGAIKNHDRLASYPFYDGALGEFLLRAGQRARAALHFRRALEKPLSKAHRELLEAKLVECADGASPN